MIRLEPGMTDGSVGSALALGEIDGSVVGPVDDGDVVGPEGEVDGPDDETFVDRPVEPTPSPPDLSPVPGSLSTPVAKAVTVPASSRTATDSRAIANTAPRRPPRDAGSG